VVAALALLAACDGDGSAPGGKEEVTPVMSDLRGGTTTVPPMKGVVELVSPDGYHCSGVMISPFAILTSARCLQPWIPAGQTSAKGVEAYYIYATNWHWRLKRWMKHCLDWPFIVEDGACVAGLKPKDLYIYRANPQYGDAANDLGLVFSTSYQWADSSDFADIYMQGSLPAGETRLQVYGYGGTAAGDPGGVYRTGSMRVASMGTNLVKLNPDSGSAQTCWGDEGGPFAIRPTVTGSAGGVVGLLSYRSEIDYTTACSLPGSKVSDHAVRIADKIAWIESIIGPCASMKDAAGRPIKRCGQMYSCTAAPAGDEYAWNGCLGSGCSACANLLTAYPNYFRNHPNCSKNTACSGKTPVGCSWNCPKPVAGDK
jgi:hypothetical protein